MVNPDLLSRAALGNTVDGMDIMFVTLAEQQPIDTRLSFRDFKVLLLRAWRSDREQLEQMRGVVAATVEARLIAEVEVTRLSNLIRDLCKQAAQPGGTGPT